MRAISCVLIAAFMLGGSIPVAEGADCTVSADATAPITLRGNYVYLPVTINDVTGNFVLDSGSATTLVDMNFARRASLQLDNHSNHYNSGITTQYYVIGAGNKNSGVYNLGHARMTKIGGLSFQDWEYGMIPLSSDKDPMDGLLGRDFQHYFDVEIDLKSKQVIFHRLHNCKTVHPFWSGDYDSIPMTPTGREFDTIPIWIDNAFLDVTLDTGAGSLLLSRDAAAKAGVSVAALAQDAAQQGSGVGGSFRIARHRFGMLLVGNGEWKSPEIAVENEPSNPYSRDGFIGLRYLQADRIWISYATQTLFVQRTQAATAKK